MNRWTNTKMTMPERYIFQIQNMIKIAGLRQNWGFLSDCMTFIPNFIIFKPLGSALDDFFLKISPLFQCLLDNTKTFSSFSYALVTKLATNCNHFQAIWAKFDLFSSSFSKAQAVKRNLTYPMCPGSQEESMPIFMLIGPKLWALEGNIHTHTDSPSFIK